MCKIMAFMAILVCLGLLFYLLLGFRYAPKPTSVVLTHNMFRAIILHSVGGLV